MGRMALLTPERPLLLTEEEPAGRELPAEPRRPVRRADDVAWWLYWGHLACLTGIAPSNVLLGLSVLAAAPGRAVRAIWRRSTKPLLLVLGLYVLQLAASALLSFDPARSLTALSELFALCTLLLGLAF